MSTWRYRTVCAFCGEPLPPGRARFCSHECNKAFHRKTRNGNWAPGKWPSKTEKEIIQDNAIAEAKGLSYGQLQAKRWATEHVKVVVPDGVLPARQNAARRKKAERDRERYRQRVLDKIAKEGAGT